ncbi:MAG: hypothetical protein C4538_02680 [Nitrospiraceae bacterium]|nr:MAG: hypothetical protein C4538_02680 [Nitrospiraceae bacterium]
MNAALKKAVSTAIVQLLRPLVKILLRNGFPYGTLCELAKWVYVDVALQEFSIEGRKQTDSRIATITGLTRKEVRRLKQITEFYDLASPERYNRAVRVISGWRNDIRFLGSKGRAKELPLDDSKTSFVTLVKDYSGDIPPRAILDEMIRAGTVEMLDGKVKLTAKGYVVTSDIIEKIHILGMDVSELISTINHNIENSPSEAFFQRKVSYDNIPEDVHMKLKKQIAEKSEEFVESLDRMISSHDRDVNPSVKGKGRRKSGIGIFYFE